MLAAPGGLLAASRTSAQFSNDLPKCPAGFKPDRIEARSVLNNLEFSVNTKAGGGKVAIPWTSTTWTIMCVADNVPKSPPQPPKKGSLWEDIAQTFDYLSLDELLQFSAYNYSVNVAMPNFASVASNSAALDLQTLKNDGTIVSTTFGLARTGTNSFALANPSAADAWCRTAALGGVSGSIRVRDIYVASNAPGSSTFGIAQYLGSRPLVGFAGTMTSGLSSGVPPKMKDY